MNQPTPKQGEALDKIVRETEEVILGIHGKPMTDWDMGALDAFEDVLDIIKRVREEDEET